MPSDFVSIHSDTRGTKPNIIAQLSLALDTIPIQSIARLPDPSWAIEVKENELVCFEIYRDIPCRYILIYNTQFHVQEIQDGGKLQLQLVQLRNTRVLFLSSLYKKSIESPESRRLEFRSIVQNDAVEMNKTWLLG